MIIENGWRVKVSPSGHQVEKYDFDVIVGADGKRNSMKGIPSNHPELINVL